MNFCAARLRFFQHFYRLQQRKLERRSSRLHYFFKSVCQCIQNIQFSKNNSFSHTLRIRNHYYSFSKVLIRQPKKPAHRPFFFLLKLDFQSGLPAFFLAGSARRRSSTRSSSATRRARWPGCPASDDSSPGTSSSCGPLRRSPCSTRRLLHSARFDFCTMSLRNNSIENMLKFQVIPILGLVPLFLSISTFVYDYYSDIELTLEYYKGSTFSTSSKEAAEVGEKLLFLFISCSILSYSYLI